VSDRVYDLHRYSVGLFDNPFYREQLFALGLRPETAYGCGYDFLLYPQPLVRPLHLCRR